MGERKYLSLEDLIDQDTTSYEFYNTLSSEVKSKLNEKDVTTFSDLVSATVDIQNNIID